MIRIFSRLFVLALALGVSMAAVAKTNVYVTEFHGDASNGEVNMIRNAVLDGLHQTNRINLYSPDSEEARYFENLRRNRDNVSQDDLETLRDLETRGSQVLILGNIDALTTSYKTNDKGETTYSATLILSLEAVNAIDGKILAKKTYEVGGGDFLIFGGGATGSTRDAAVQKLPGHVNRKMKEFIELVFPIQGSILEFEKYKDGKDGKVETLYIDLGTEQGVVAGTKFEVKLERTIGNKKSFTTIGKLEAKEVQGDEITLCQVKGGKQEIYKAFKGAQTLHVISCQ